MMHRPGLPAFLFRAGVAAAAGAVLAACASAPMPADRGTLHQIDKAVKEGAEQPRVPPEVSQALVPPMDLGGGANAPAAAAEPHFDVAATHMSAREFFMTLMKGTPYNIVVSPEVKGSVSLHLKDVTVSRVMDVVRDIYGYEYEYGDGLYKVFPARMQSRLFPVSYIDVKRVGASNVRITTGEITENNINNQISNTVTSTGATSNSHSGSTQTSGSTVNTTSEADFWNDLQATLQSMVGDGGGRKVIVNPGAGIVIVHALPAELRDVSRFLDQIQNIVHREVILEAKVLEVQLNNKSQAGINWAALGQINAQNSVLGAQVGGGSIFSKGASDIAGNTGNLIPGAGYNPITGTQSSAFGGIFTLALNLNDFNAFVELLKTQGDVQVLSSPRIATVNNQKAVIKVGTDEFFVTNVSTTTTSSAGGLTTTPSITLTPFFSGIALDVTPEISANRDVILHVHPSVSEVSDQTKSFTVGNQSEQLPLAFSSIRESDNVIRAANGQIVMIGGLMQEKTTNNVAGVPVLSDLPLLGRLFRHTQRVKQKSELIILLRPTVVGVSGQEWSRSMRKSLDTFEQMDQ